MGRGVAVTRGNLGGVCALFLVVSSSWWISFFWRTSWILFGPCACWICVPLTKKSTRWGWPWTKRVVAWWWEGRRVSRPGCIFGNLVHLTISSQIARACLATNVLACSLSQSRLPIYQLFRFWWCDIKNFSVNFSKIQNLDSNIFEKNAYVAREAELGSSCLPADINPEQDVRKKFLIWCIIRVRG